MLGSETPRHFVSLTEFTIDLCCKAIKRSLEHVANSYVTNTHVFVPLLQ